MPYKPTGRPPGRPRGATSIRSPDKAHKVLAGKPDLGLTADQINAAGPLDALHALMRHALRMGDMDRARAAARDLAPYMHAKAQPPLEVTLEQLHQIGELARAEAVRRGYDLDAPDPAAKPH